MCAYSGLKIYPGHGKTLVKVDGKVENYNHFFFQAINKNKHKLVINSTVIYFPQWKMRSRSLDET